MSTTARKQENYEGTVTVTIRLTADVIEWIDQQAAKARRSRANWIRNVLEQTRDEQEGETQTHRKHA